MASPPPQEQQEPDFFKAMSTFLTLLGPMLPPRPYGPYQYEGPPMPDEPAILLDPPLEQADPPPPPRLPPIIHLYPPLTSASTLKERVNKWMGDAYLDTYLEMARRSHQGPERYTVEDGEELYRALVDLHDALEDEVTTSEATFDRLLMRMEKRGMEIWNVLMRMSTEPEELKMKLIKFNTAWGIFPPGWDPYNPPKNLYAMYDSVPLRVLFDVDDLQDLRRWMLEDYDDGEARRNAQDGQEEPYMVLTCNLIGPTLSSWISWATGQTSTAQETEPSPPPPPQAPLIPSEAPTEQGSVASSSRPVDQRRASKQRIQRMVENLLDRLGRMRRTEDVRRRILEREYLIRPTAICVRTQMDRIISEQRTGRVPTAGVALCASFSTGAYASKPLDALEELLINLSELLLCKHLPWLT